MPTINMLSSAMKVKGQGVGSAYLEQINLVSKGLSEKYSVYSNSREKCDINHYHTIDLPFYFHSVFYKGANIGYVHFLPETIDDSLTMPKLWRKVFYKYMIEFYSNMDFLVTVNPCFIPKLKAHGIKSDKIVYIPNYVSDAEFYPLDSPEIVAGKQKYNIPANKFIVLGVGQVQTRKGVLDLIKTAELLKDEDIHFVWAGGFSFGKMTSGYKELREVMDNPPPNVTFLGIVSRDEMNMVFNMSDVFFLPSYNELFPMSVLEAMSCSKPILLRDLDLYNEILFDYYMKASDTEGFADIIKRLSVNADYYNYYKQKACQGHNYYSKNHVLKMWEEFYDRVYAEYAVDKFKLFRIN